jgi:hypothetical protein
MRNQLPLILIGVFLACVVAIAIFLLLSPPESLVWRFESLRADVLYALKPPQQVVFVPTEASLATTSETLPPSSHTPVLPVVSPTAILSLPTETLTPLPVPTRTPTPLPERIRLTGVLHEYQMWNNCGPANLAMALSFWGWRGDQRQTAAFLKPNKMDKNVMPYEMLDFVYQETDLAASVRVGGDFEMLKALIASGFPVIVEKGFEGIGFSGWMGHYQVLTGYDDAVQHFIAQDSYKGANQTVSYTDLLSQWRAFNYTYLIVYPPDRRDQVLTILDLQAFDNYNNRYALQKSLDDAARLTGRDLYFALFNQGTNNVALKDYASAAAAYDAAFANYALLPEEIRPWRMLWYQTGPYFAYYYTGRYQDVINLVTVTLDNIKSDPVLEESFYWRAMAYLALVDQEPAVKDLRQCLVAHPGFVPCVDQLKNLGLEP